MSRNGFRTTIITQPTVEPVTLSELKLHLGMDIDDFLDDDEWFSEILIAARMEVEKDTRRKLITQTIDFFPSRWPNSSDRYPDRIRIPFGNLQTVTSVAYKDTAGTSVPLTLTTDYLVELNGDKCGYIVLPYGCSWPTTTLYPSNPITIRFVCGYGLASSVPRAVKQAIKRRCTDYDANRGEDSISNFSSTSIPDKTYDRIILSVPPLYDEEFL